MADYRFPGEHMYKNLVLSGAETDRAVDKIRELSVVEGDILIATYPKTGTTWMEELVWLVTHGGDTTEAMSKKLSRRMLFLEFAQSYDDGKSGIDKLETYDRPCIMKTHLPAWIYEKQLKNDRLKIIVVIRNPKDTLVSMYHFYRMNAGLGNFSGSWNDFFELFKAKHVMDGDYFDWYSSWIPYLDQPNIQLVTFEDMKYKFDDVLTSLTKFLGKKLTDEKVSVVKDHTSFDKMKDNPMTNNNDDPDLNKNISPFIRKGVVGDWKKHFSPEQSVFVDKLYEEKLHSKGITLKFE